MSVKKIDMSSGMVTIGTHVYSTGYMQRSPKCGWSVFLLVENGIEEKRFHFICKLDVLKLMIRYVTYV